MRREREPRKNGLTYTECLWLPVSGDAFSIDNVQAWVSTVTSNDKTVTSIADPPLGLDSLLESGFTLETIATKSWVLRRVLESMRRAFDENLGVVTVDVGDTPDIERVVLNIQMSMGACGFVVEQYPVPTFATAILVRITDRALAETSSLGGTLHADAR